MDQVYNNKMNELGYNQLVCDIFLNWEDVKDEILLPERKHGSGNGTIHVFLGAADAALREEFPSYYEAVDKGEDTSVGAIEVKHYFTPSNIISMLGYVCKYLHDKEQDVETTVSSILEYLSTSQYESGLLCTKSFFKLSVGSNRLRPYFKQFESNGVFTKLVRQVLLPNSSYKISLYKNEDGEYAAFWLIGFNWLNDFEADSNGEYIENTQKQKSGEKLSITLQQIFYGAPGTGKSHTINKQTEGESVIRTTFHPDSDYSTFVGAYKPTMGLLPICDELGQPMKIGSSVLHKEQIIYEFVDQAFLQAYVNAWKYYADNSEEIKKQYLIIEEINRGNCAQIFGDLFQLLDRNDSGFSVYPINADKDMKKHLEKAFKGVRIDNADSINQHYKGRNVVKEVLDGDILLLPNNLYIWATMNTSDQSLFPIDSAFKRRWEWQYMPIGKGYDENGQEIKWAIEGATQKYDWWSFLEKINAQVGKATQSEDKKLGFFFCKATDGVISAEKFVGKVIFYLWNDVFKNNVFDGPIFQDADKTELSFGKFYKSDMKGNAIVQKDKVELFLNNLGVEVSEQNVDREEDNSAPAGTKEKILAFWQGFNNARNENQEYCNIYNERKPLAQTFMDLSFGSSEYWPTMNAVITKSIIRCGIWIGVSSNKDAIYSKLKANETAINELVGARMIFTENTKTCSIMAEKKIDLNDESNWPEAYMWLMDIAIKIKKVKDQFGF